MHQKGLGYRHHCGFFSNLFPQSNFFFILFLRGICDSLSTAWIWAIIFHPLIWMLRKNKGHQIWSYSFWCKYAGDPSSIWEHCHVDWCRPALLLAKCGRKKTDERGRSTGCRDKLTTVSSVQPYLFLVSFFFLPFIRISVSADVSIRMRRGKSYSTFRFHFGCLVNFIESRQTNWKKGGHSSCNQSLRFFFFSVTCDWLHFRYVSRTFFPQCRRHTENHAQLQFFCFLIAFYFLFPLECLTVPL